MQILGKKLFFHYELLYVQENLIFYRKSHTLSAISQERAISHDLVKKCWFLAGLLLVFAVTVADTSETVSGVGRWFKMHRGPEAVIVLIFFFSGLMLNAWQIRSGLMDIKGLVITLAIIFLVAPITAASIGLAPLDIGIKIGFF